MSDREMGSDRGSDAAADQSRLQIGDIVVEAEGGQISFQREGESTVNLKLEGMALSELLDFLRSVRVDQQNRRRGFRVPVVSNRLQAQLGAPHDKARARARDVSLSGIFLEFPEGVPELQVNDRVDIAISHGNDDAAMRGIVKRRTDAGLGIEFGHAADTESPTPPAEFARIVMLLEKEWLADRLGT